MTALRPNGVAFSQAAIARAYARQLHLKQIAHLRAMLALKPAW